MIFYSLETEAVDKDGSSMTQHEVTPADNADICLTFAVPEGLRSINITFNAKIQVSFPYTYTHSHKHTTQHTHTHTHTLTHTRTHTQQTPD